MDYYQVAFKTKAENVEILLALLTNFPFEAFEEQEHGIDAFIPLQQYTSKIENEIFDLQQLVDFSFQKIEIKNQNWNAVWESNFQPIIIDDFCGIRADFHEPLNALQYEIIINPKMAFGTGHHETTFMMVKKMASLPFQNKSVFDFGCGTGILAILASMMGATTIDALDIELPSFENTLENARINKVEHIQAIHGTLEKVKMKMYDIILANINRHVILDSLPTLKKMLNADGILLISGILETDEDLLKLETERHGFEIKNIIKKNNWLAISCMTSNQTITPSN